MVHDPGKRCNCDVECGDRGDCCSDYNAVCLPPTPGTTCSGGAHSANLPLAECQAMQGLFDATGGPGWTNCATTFRADPCGCSAAKAGGGGVTCKTSKGTGAAPGSTHVTDIYLGTSGLSGSLPSSLRELGQLQWLQLACNRISGAIPPNMLDWDSFGTGRDDRCELMTPPGDCLPVALNNNFSCPIPEGAKDHCMASCVHKPGPTPSDCVSVAGRWLWTT